jgi:uncharacterized protein (DUF58 family)
MKQGSALVLGGIVLFAAIVVASRPLGVVGIGLIVAALISRAWVGIVRGPMDVVSTVEPEPATEGEEVRLRFEARRSSRTPVGAVVLSGTLGRLGRYECRLRGRGRSAAGHVSLGRLPRGRFVSSDGELELSDPLGLESVSRPLETTVAVVVHPRLVELQTLFSDAGRFGSEGRRQLLRRPAGFDFHSVREYEQGESLRRVHWPTTAKRGQLMVKELEESPRDGVVVLLDCDPAGQAGEPPRSSFDQAARAAGSILRAYAVRGRRVVLVTTGRQRVAVQSASLRDFRAILGALAAAEPDAPYELASALGRANTPVAPAAELVVVTASLGARAAERLLDAATRRLVSVVWLDAPSFRGRPTRIGPGVLRLTHAGIPVAVIRHGDDLCAALELGRRKARAHG